MKHEQLPTCPWKPTSFQKPFFPTFSVHPTASCLEGSLTDFFFHGTGMCQDVNCLLWASLSGKYPFISYRLKLYLPKIRKHHNIVTKHQRGDTLILLNPFCPGQWCVMSSTPEAVCRGEKRNSSDCDRKGIKTPMVSWPLDFRDLTQVDEKTAH